MTLSKAVHSSKCHRYETPDAVIWAAKAMAGGVIALDAAASITNRLAPLYYDGTTGQDGLIAPWASKGWTWCNPPYGRGIINWIAKAAKERAAGRASMLLLPARPDTKWFKLAHAHAAEIVFWTGRIRFSIDGIPDSAAAPFPSALFFFRPDDRPATDQNLEAMKAHGIVLRCRT